MHRSIKLEHGRRSSIQPLRGPARSVRRCRCAIQSLTGGAQNKHLPGRLHGWEMLYSIWGNDHGCSIPLISIRFDSETVWFFIFFLYSVFDKIDLDFSLTICYIHFYILLETSKIDLDFILTIYYTVHSFFSYLLGKLFITLSTFFCCCCKGHKLVRNVITRLPVQLIPR